MLRHFALLSGANKDHTFEDLERTYKDPENRCNSNQNGSGSSPGSTSLSAKVTPGVAASGYCVTNVTGEATLTTLSGLGKPAIVYLQSAGDDDIYHLPCDTPTNAGTYDLADGTDVSYDVESGFASDTDVGRCGPQGFPILQYGYTQDCLDHDICVTETEGSVFPTDANCGDEFNEAIGDYLFSNRFYCQLPTPFAVKNFDSPRPSGSSVLKEA